MQTAYGQAVSAGSALRGHLNPFRCGAPAQLPRHTTVWHAFLVWHLLIIHGYPALTPGS
jgi:hypothetical protein